MSQLESRLVAVEQESEAERSRLVAQCKAARDEAEGLRQKMEEAEAGWTQVQQVRGGRWR